MKDRLATIPPVRETKAMYAIDAATPREPDALVVFPGDELQRLGYSPKGILPVLERMEKRDMLVPGSDRTAIVAWRRPPGFSSFRSRTCWAAATPRRSRAVCRRQREPAMARGR